MAQIGNLFKVGVSIHTPTKGVTADDATKAAADAFQSTHPRRV